MPWGWVTDLRMETLLHSVVLIDIQPTESAQKACAVVLVTGETGSNPQTVPCLHGTSLLWVVFIHPILCFCTSECCQAVTTNDMIPVRNAGTTVKQRTLDLLQHIVSQGPNHLSGNGCLVSWGCGKKPTSSV